MSQVATHAVAVEPAETPLTDGVPGTDGGTAAAAVSEVSADVMNCAMFDAADATPWLSTAVT